ncbi:hypothetical protein A1O3_02804 [Capronia epimyces CBS 606.96]|uniref:DNA replication regulator SLD2 n=1 Tax=Capronia epimyces CBS 606.96 TaxID=1182542 RepID=W9YA50_9EURO|nr:uncharacterized protein A1O3_02804 [Capronia epimyces CBS 606.96]EXJ89737.1 hypothetical protein A1O3_02804 [Capronia epimyces CBS 606.96]
MDDAIPLLDTPKRKSIQSRADALRTALKDFERSFAAKNDGRKPSKEDIKTDAVVAAKYKEYNKVRDVLAGRLSLDVLHAPQTRRRHEHTRTDSAISLTPNRPRHIVNTPSKARLHPNDIDPYDAPSSISPKVIPSAIGPTPRRDGTVLGIFDLLPRSGSARTATSQETPSSRKRKIDWLFDTQDGDKGLNVAIAQTPSQRRSKQAENGPGSMLTITPRSHVLNTGRRQHSKTPASEGKKFMLNHFFATPSAIRFATMIDADDADVHAKSPAQSSKTPLRDIVLGRSPSKDDGAVVTMDATPPYLKRSFSFKERLLSASAGSTTVSSSWKNATSPTLRRAGPRTLRHAKFGPKPLSQMIADLQSQSAEVRDEHDDDLDALREMESTKLNILVGDSQVEETPTEVDHGPSAEPVRTWTKKGQKRTTRRVIMRPVRMKPAELPKFVAAEEDDDDELALDNQCDDEDDVNDTSRMEETQIDSAIGPEPESDVDSELDYLIAQAERDGDEDEFFPENEQCTTSPRKGAGAKKKASATSRQPQLESDISGKRISKTSSRHKGKKAALGTEGDEVAMRTINPNAHSHMNFRSLKIKNKNSKAKGRGRYGRGRR